MNREEIINGIVDDLLKIKSYIDSPDCRHSYAYSSERLRRDLSAAVENALNSERAPLKIEERKFVVEQAVNLVSTSRENLNINDAVEKIDSYMRNGTVEQRTQK